MTGALPYGLRIKARRGSFAALVTGLCLGAGAAAAQNATWVGGNGGDPSEWVEPNNWTPTSVPSATANFTNTANTANVANDNGVVTIGTVNFTATALAYTFSIDNPFIVNGAGVVNNSSNTQTFNVTSGNALVFQSSSSANSGTGAVIYNNGGFMFFQNTSTAGNSNTTIVNNEILQFNDSSSAGSAHITNNVETDFFNSSTAGSANITNAATGTLTFNNTSTAGNAIIGNSGVLDFTNSSTAGNANITNNSAATVDFFNSSAAATATIGNAGTATFHDTSTASAAAITNNSGSFLNFQDASTAGSANIINNALGTTQFLNTSTAGSATITNAVNGITNFFDSATAGNAIINNNGGLTQFNNSSTAGSAIITTNSGGGVFFVGTSNGGEAAFTTNAGGVFDISGLTSGGTTAGSIAGAGAYFLGANALTIGSNNLSTTVSGVISDGGLSGGTGGSLVKVGTGNLTLTGTNTYTGATTIDAGTLLVNGSIATSSGVTVNAGGTLGGTGTVSATTVMSGGTLAPGPGGGTIGTLTIAGNLAFQSGAIYMVQVNPANASLANVTAGGTATLAGTVQAIFAPGTYMQRSYDILSAAGLTGTFSSVSAVNLPKDFGVKLSYTGTDAFLNLVALLPTNGLNTNQRNVSNAIDGFFNNGGSLPPGFVSLFGLSGANLANALSQLSGEASTGMRDGAFRIMNSFMGLLIDPFADYRGGSFGPASPFAAEPNPLPPDIAHAYAAVLKAPPPAAYTPHWNVWGAPFGGASQASGDPIVGSHDTSTAAGGFAVGADYLASPDTVLGFALAGGATSWSLSGGLGSGRSDVFQAGIYGAHQVGAAYFSGTLAFADYMASTNRTVAVAGVDTLAASFNAQSYGGRLESGYHVFITPFTLTPYGAVQVVDFNAPAYSETASSGSSQFALSYNAQTGTETRSELGSWADKTFLLADANSLKLFGRAAWAHDWITNPALGAVFLSLPTASFVVNGAMQPVDLALVSAGAEWRLHNGWSVLAKFDGEFGRGSQTYSGTGRLRYTW